MKCGVKNAKIRFLVKKLWTRDRFGLKIPDGRFFNFFLKLSTYPLHVEIFLFKITFLHLYNKISVLLLIATTEKTTLIFKKISGEINSYGA